MGRDHRVAQWRAAPQGGPGRAAGRRVGRDRPGRADQPPGHRGHRLAGRAREDPLAEELRRAAGHHARSVVPRRGLHRDVGGARRDRGAVRGRLRGLRAAAGGAGSDRGGHRGEAAEPHAQGAGVAAARTARPHEQAEVPDRRRQPAHRGRATGAQPDRAAAARGRSSGQGRDRPRSRGCALRRSRGLARRDLADRAGRADRDPRGQRQWQVHAAGVDRRHGAARLRAGQARQDRATRDAGSTVLAARGHPRGPGAGGAGADSDDVHDRRQGPDARAAAGTTRLRPRAPLDPRRRAVRWAEAATPAAAAPARRTQCDRAGRTDERRGLGHARRHGGPAGLLAGNADRGLPRPLPA